MAAPGARTISAAGLGAPAQRRHVYPAGRRLRHRHQHRLALRPRRRRPARRPRRRRHRRRPPRSPTGVRHPRRHPHPDRSSRQPEALYSGKRKRHGVNVQVLADPSGRLVWASPALPGGVHDLTAARTHALIDTLTSRGVMTLADKGYQAPAAQSAHRSSAIALDPGSRDASVPSTDPTPAFAASVNAQLQPSRPARS